MLVLCNRTLIAPRQVKTYHSQYTYLHDLYTKLNHRYDIHICHKIFSYILCNRTRTLQIDSDLYKNYYYNIHIAWIPIYTKIYGMTQFFHNGDKNIHFCFCLSI